MLRLLKLKPVRSAQSILEYVMLFAIVATAVGVTYKYVYHSINARLKNTQEELTYSRSVDEADEFSVNGESDPSGDGDPSGTCSGSCILGPAEGYGDNVYDGGLWTMVNGECVCVGYGFDFGGW